MSGSPQNYPVPFTDTTPVFNAELWNPVTETFTVLAKASVPRNYHSIALLLPDGTVFNGGGGLCGVGCACARPCHSRVRIKESLLPSSHAGQLF